MVRTSEHNSYNTISTSRSSTNKPKKAISKLPRHIGIDKLHISIPLYPDNTDGSHRMWTKKRYANTGNGQEIVKFEGILEVAPRQTIHVAIFNFGTSAELQFNPSRVVDGDGSALCPIESLKSTVLWALKQLENIITPEWCLDTQTGEILTDWPSDWYSRIRPTRIDIAADFSADEEFDVKTIRQSVSNAHREIGTYENRGTCNSLVWGKKPWLREIFYNKGAHKVHVDSKNIYRFEVQLYRGFIRDNGWQNLEKITASKTMGLLQERWLKSGLSQGFSLDSDFAALYAQLLTLVIPSKAMNYLGSALVASEGLTLGIHPKTIKEYKKLSQKLGFSFGDDIMNMSAEVFSLDLKKGKMVQQKRQKI